MPVPRLRVEPLEVRDTPAVTITDPQAANAWQFKLTDAAAAWGVSTGTGQTIVAVIDSGVDVTHPDLAANLWTNPREIAGNGRDDDGNGYADDVHGWNFVNNSANLTDNVGHGTYAAGLVGAVGGNGLGTTGVNPRARVMPLKFFDTAAGGFTSDAARAVDYAVANGAKVISASWGSPASGDPVLAAAIGRARAAGVIFVASAGNSAADTDQTPSYPAGYALSSDNVVSVAASTPDDTLAAFSNYGRTSVTLAAPGQWVTTTAPGGGYAEKSGTSMAAPFVAGAVSLLWDVHPDWTYRQVIDKLKASVDVLPAFQGKVATGGRIDLGKLLDVVPPAPPVTPPPSSTAQAVEAVLGGSKAGSLDRAWVRFASPADPAAVAAANLFWTPFGPVKASAVLPVAGTNNTQFVLTMPRTYTTPGLYIVVMYPPLPYFEQRLTLGGAPVVSPPVAPPVAPPVVPPVAPPTVPVAGRVSYTANGLPVAVQDGRTTRVEVYVPTAATARDVAVQLTVQHGRVSDLNIRLTAPDGRKFVLFNRRGGGGANLSGITFADGGLALASAAAPFAGSFQPEQSLAALNGTSAKGLWVVELFDLGAGVGGTLTGVTLSFAATAPQTVAVPATVQPMSVTLASTTAPPRSVSKPLMALDARPDAIVLPPTIRPMVARAAAATAAPFRDRLG